MPGAEQRCQAARAASWCDGRVDAGAAPRTAGSRIAKRMDHASVWSARV
jgi:hypothetical protein